MTETKSIVAEQPGEKILVLDCGPIQDTVNGRPGALIPANTVSVKLTATELPRLEQVTVNGKPVTWAQANGPLGLYFQTVARHITRNPEILDAWAHMITLRAKHLRHAKGSAS